MDRKEFIAVTASRGIVALGPTANAADFPGVVERAIRVANILEEKGESPWTPAPRPVLAVPPAALAAMGAPPVAGSAAEENTRRLLANLPPGTQLAPVQAQGNPQPAGSPGNPVTSGAVIASMGEVQGVQETQASVVVNPQNIIPAFSNPTG